MCDDQTNFSIILKDIAEEDLAALKRLSDEIIQASEDGDVFFEPTLGLGRHIPEDNTYLIDNDTTNSTPDIAAEFIQGFLQERRPDCFVGFEVAYTCSKNRPGHLGGAGYFVTADKWEAMGTSEWLYEQTKNLPLVKMADLKV